MTLRCESTNELNPEFVEDNREVLKEAGIRVRTQGPLSEPATNKYHAIRTEYAGRKYPSKKQAEDTAKFQSLVGPGKPYKAYLEEVPFKLPGHTPTGRSIVHRVDHCLIDWSDKAWWYETKCKAFKGRAPMGELKRSQVEQLYFIKIEVI